MLSPGCGVFWGAVLLFVLQAVANRPRIPPLEPPREAASEVMALSIVSWGGIGDTLRNLSLVPHVALYRRFGVRCRVVYIHWRRVGSLEHAEPPEASFFEEIVARCPSLRWAGETESHHGHGRWVNRLLREAIKKLHGNIPPYFPFEIPLTPSERAQLPALDPGALTVGIQTHLSGMKTKRWDLENWRAVLEGLLAANPRLSILLLETDPRVADLHLDSRVHSTLGLNICQSIHLAGRCDFLVSVDSWAKYVAVARRIPQLVIVPDQRSEYPSLTAHKLVREEFAGIYGRPGNRVIGLSGSSREPALSLPCMAELSPHFLTQQIQEALDALAPPCCPVSPAAAPVRPVPASARGPR